jgi:hypothetical protein
MEKRQVFVKTIENILFLPLHLLCEMTEFFLARMSLLVNPLPSIVAIIFLMNLL